MHKKWRGPQVVFVLMLVVIVHQNLLAYYPPRFQAGANFLLAFPQGEFDDIVNRAGVGGSGGFLYSLSFVPVAIGLSAAYINYGSDTRREPIVPGVTVDVNTSNNIATLHLLVRAIPGKGSVRPYLDGLIGFNYLFTQTIVKNRSGGEEIASTINFDDFAFSYGGGGGVLINLFRKPLEGNEIDAGFFAVNLDLRLRYLFGSQAEYLHEGSITIVSDEVYYDVSKSVTDMITAQVGVVLEF